MDKGVFKIINEDFKEELRGTVIKELFSIGLNHVMAKSEDNLKSTRLSILYLAKGKLSEVIELTKRAKIDFRDVIMMAIKERTAE